MKLKTIFCNLMASGLLITLMSCSTTESLTPNYPYLSQLANTPCLNSKASGLEYVIDNSTTFEMKITDTTAECVFKSLQYPCDFEKVNVDISYDNGTITVIEYPSSDLADCLCEVDATFTIEDIPRNSFILKIYRANTQGEYDPDKPTLEKLIEVKNCFLLFQYPEAQ